MFDVGASPGDKLPRFRLLYQGFPSSGSSFKYMQLLLSHDGRNWQPYAPARPAPAAPAAAGAQDQPNQTPPPGNSVFPLGSLEVNGYLDDLAAVRAGRPELRFKALLTNTSVLASADAVHWHVMPGAVWRPHACDPRGSVAYDAPTQTYVFLSRPGPSDRRIALHTAPASFGLGNATVADLSPQHLRMESDALDPPLTQMYGMPLQPYAGSWLGFLWRFKTLQGGEVHKYSGGMVDAQLAFGDSPYGMQRASRSVLAPAGPWAQWVAQGMFYPTSIMADPADPHGWDAILVASASQGQHGDRAANSSLLFMSVPADRWVGLGTTGAAAGHLRTRMLAWHGGQGALNARLPTAAEVQAVDTHGKALPGFSLADALPLVGDGAGLVPRWQGNKTLEQLAGQTFALELVLPRNATLYSLRGDYALES